MIELTMAESGHKPVPVGAYQATFTAFEPRETKAGAAYRWVFQTDSGLTVSEFSDAAAAPTPNNKTGRFIAALLGRAVRAGEKFTPESYIGQRYMLVITPKGTEGQTKLETFTKIQ